MIIKKMHVAYLNMAMVFSREFEWAFVPLYRNLGCIDLSGYSPDQSNVSLDDCYGIQHCLNAAVHL
jgi:hypothetical protein